jgi:hypothetical protein
MAMTYPIPWYGGSALGVDLDAISDMKVMTGGFRLNMETPNPA